MVARIRRFLERDLWTLDAARRGPGWSAAVGLARTVVTVVRALTDAQLNLEATALVYRTLLSIVPLLAVAFSVLKAFGAHYKLDAIVARFLEPLGAGGAELASQLVGFVDNLRVSVLGAIGFVMLFYTVVSVIERIESAFNRIWHVRRPRSLTRKFSDYLSIVLVGPVLVFGAFALMAAAQNYWLVQRVLAATRLTEVAVFVARHGAPFVLLVAAFSLLYRLLPHTHVTVRAAFVGGVTAAFMWHLAGYGFALFVASSSSYTAIYSGAAVFLISLIWLQLAWLILLTGAQVAYVYQHPIASVILRGRPSLLLRERIGLGALVDITRRYLASAGPSQAEQLALALNAPLGTLEDVIEDFVAAGLLVYTREPAGVLLARSPDLVSVVDVLDAIREPPASYDVDPAVLPDAVTDALHRRDEATRATLGSVTLRSLATASDAAVPDAARLVPRDRDRAA
jgi:membrane protein